MTTVIVESTDKELLRAIRLLKTDDIVFDELMLKAAGSPGRITASIKLATVSLAFITALLLLADTHSKKHPHSTKIHIQCTVLTEEIREITARAQHKIDVDIEIHEEH